MRGIVLMTNHNHFYVKVAGVGTYTSVTASEFKQVIAFCESTSKHTLPFTSTYDIVQTRYMYNGECIAINELEVKL